MSLNKVMLIGNLTRDPEMRNTPNGQPVTTFSIATSLRWTDQSGQKQEKAEFHNIVAWRKLAEICGQYLHKGSKVYLEGRLQTRTWEKEGAKQYRTEIIAENMEMLDRLGGENRSSGTNSAPAMSEESAPAETGEEEIRIENIPF